MLPLATRATRNCLLRSPATKHVRQLPSSRRFVFFTRAYGIADELDEARAQVMSMPEAQAFEAAQRRGSHAEAVQSVARVAEIMASMPDPSFQHVGAELECRADFLRGQLFRASKNTRQSTALTSRLHEGGDENGSGPSRPVAALRFTNLAALLLLREGNHRDALALLKKAKRTSGAWLDSDPSLAQNEGFKALRHLLTIQLAVSAMTQGIFDTSWTSLSFTSQFAEGNVVMSTLSQIALLHQRRCQIHEWIASGSSSPPLEVGLVGSKGEHASIDLDAVATAAEEANSACRGLPHGPALEALHLLQLADVQSLLNAPAQDIDQTLSSATAAGEAGPNGIPSAAAAPLRSLARLFETASGDITTAEALHTANADNIGAWYKRDVRCGTWTTLQGVDAADNDAVAVCVSDSSIAEEYMRNLMSRAALIGRLEWNGKKRSREEHKLLSTADEVVKAYPELKSAHAAAVRTCGAAPSTSNGQLKPVPSNGEVVDVTVVPTWHFDLCFAVLYG